MAISLSRPVDSQGLSFLSDGNRGSDRIPAARRGDYRLSLDVVRRSLVAAVVRECAWGAGARSRDDAGVVFIGLTMTASTPGVASPTGGGGGGGGETPAIPAAPPRC